MIERTRLELELFKEHQQYFSRTFSANFSEIDEHGFSVTESPGELDLFLVGLTHGNEVIGIEIINKFLSRLRKHNNQTNLPFNFAVLLNNVKAYLENTRFLESDLNRSFLRKELITSEHFRAHQIEQIFSRFNQIDFVFDLHQTSESSLGPFTIFAEKENLIRLAHQIAPHMPMITYSDQGFSEKGKTLGEFLSKKGVKSVVFELGQKGYNTDISEEMLQSIFNYSQIKPPNKDFPYKINYWSIVDQIPLKPEFRLAPGLANLMKVSPDQVLVYHEDQPVYKSPQEGILVFPRYSQITESDTNLGLIATYKELFISE